MSTDWSVSVGGRIGWLANEQTLLYFLAAYTHVDLSDAQVNVNIPDPNDLVGVVLGGAPGTGPFPNSPSSLLVKLPDSVDGFSLGGGGEAKIGGPWSVKLNTDGHISREAQANLRTTSRNAALRARTQAASCFAISAAMPPPISTSMSRQ